MKNRVEKLLKEKRKALTNIKLAKGRSVFLRQVNASKDRDYSEKQRYREMMQQKLREQRELCAKQRREVYEGVQSSKAAKVEENRDKKYQELHTKEVKKQEKAKLSSIQNEKTMQLKESVINHRKQKSQKLDDLVNTKNDISQIRYHLKNEKLGSTRDLHRQEIEQLQQKEKEILEKLRHTLERQERIENEANSPIKFRRAPSLNLEAKYALLQNKFQDKSFVNKKLNKQNETFASVIRKDSFEQENEIEDSEFNRKDSEEPVKAK